MTIARDHSSSPTLTSALMWLKAPPVGDPLHDLAPLRHHLRSVVDAEVAPLERLRLLQPFQTRADAIGAALRPLLLSTTLPLSPRQHLIAQGLADIHGLLAATLLRAIRKLSLRQLADAGENLPTLCDLILNNLSQQQQVALLAAAGPPPDLWRQAQVAYSLLGANRSRETAAARNRFKHMLALAAAQPETFTGEEIACLIDYLADSCADVVIDPQPERPLGSWYWLDESHGLPPIAVIRRPPPAGGQTLYFCCTAIARTADEHLHRLAAGDTSAASGLPSRLGEEDFRALLSKAAARWSAPPRRRHHHRPSNYSVEICPQIDRLWDLLGGNAADKAERADSSLTQWTVLNESPGGFAMQHVSGSISGLVSGSAIGLRISPERPWNICLVRWARSDNAQHVELGLELIAPSAAPVQIVRHQGDDESRLSPALLLHSAHDRHRRESLLTARSRAAARPFTLIAVPKGRKLQLTECQVSRLALQTSSVEMLEFSRDRSPR